MSALVFERLAELILEYSEVERSVEVTRQVLVENPLFDACHAFWRLDRRMVEEISRNDLRLFLEENNIYPTSAELRALFYALDRNQDGRIDWREFTRTILARESTYRDYSRRTDGLSLEVEHSLARVLEEELAGLKRLERLKRDLIAIPDFEYVATFDALDISGRGWLSLEDLLEFLASQLGSVSRSRVERAFCRLDQNDDGRLSLKEWQDGLIPLDVPEEYSIQQGTGSLRRSAGLVVRRSNDRTIVDRETTRTSVIESGNNRTTTITRSPKKVTTVTRSPGRVTSITRSPEGDTTIINRSGNRTTTITRSPGRYQEETRVVSPRRRVVEERNYISPSRRTTTITRSPTRVVEETRVTSPSRRVVETRYGSPSRRVVETRYESPSRRVVEERRVTSPSRRVVEETRYSSPGRRVVEETRYLSPSRKTTTITRSPGREEIVEREYTEEEPVNRTVISRPGRTTTILKSPGREEITTRSPGRTTTITRGADGERVISRGTYDETELRRSGAWREERSRRYSPSYESRVVRETTSYRGDVIEREERVNSPGRTVVTREVLSPSRRALERSLRRSAQRDAEIRRSIERQAELEDSVRRSREIRRRNYERQAELEHSIRRSREIRQDIANSAMERSLRRSREIERQIDREIGLHEETRKSRNLQDSLENNQSVRKTVETEDRIRRTIRDTYPDGRTEIREEYVTPAKIGQESRDQSYIERTGEEDRHREAERQMEESALKKSFAGRRTQLP